MKDPAEQFCGGRTCPNICRGLAKFLFASSQKCDSPFRGSCEVWIFHEVEWGNETGEQCSPLQIYCRGGACFSRFFIQFSSCVRGATLGIMPLVAYTQNTAMHTHALTQVLYSLFQNLSSYSLSRRACTCPQVSKRFLLIPEKHHFCCIKNATIAEMLPN